MNISSFRIGQPYIDLAPIWEYKGEFSLSSAYTPGQLVSYSNSIYLCLKMSKGYLPPTAKEYFQFLISDLPIIPSGGSINQVLKKTSTGYTWANANSVGGGSLKWLDLTTGYKTEPTLVSSISTGDVYSYVFQSSPSDVTYYRLVPSSTAPDAFYSSFSGGILSGEIARKQTTI